MNKVRALVIDDSSICRAELKRMLERSGRIQVVGEAPNGQGVLDLVERCSPQILVLDLQMPHFDGLATLELVMAQRPLPVLVVTGQPGGRSQDRVFESLRRGALDLAEKPSARDSASQAALCEKVIALSAIPVVRHPLGKVKSEFMRAALAVPKEMPAPLKLVGIASSAGGPSALVSLLAELGPNFGAAVTVVQHLPPGFGTSFASFVSGRISLPVTIVDSRVRIQAGRVYLAPDARHLVAEDPEHLGVLASPAVGGNLPSADVLFASLAKVFGPNATGVVLSGMGNDGTAGLAAMRARGSLTLAQDAASSAVFGMPKAALEAGAASEALDPGGIARVLVAQVARPGERKAFRT